MVLQISPLTSSLASRGRFDIPCSTAVRISLTGTLLGVIAKFIPFLRSDISSVSRSRFEAFSTHLSLFLRVCCHWRLGPVQHKRSVVSTLRRRANTIPSSQALRTEEASRVQNSLQFNGYPTKFIENAAQPRSGSRNHHPDPAGLAVVPYVQGISDRVKRTLQQFNIKTAFKPMQTLASVFKKPKERPSEEKIADIVYRVQCKGCDFSYISESKRRWASRKVEHDTARHPSTLRRNSWKEWN